MSAARVTVLDAAVLERLRTRQLRDAIDDAAPHALVATSAGARNRLRASPAVPDDLPVLFVGGRRPSDDDPPTVREFGAVQLLLADSDADLAAVSSLAADGAIDPDAQTYVFSNRLSLSVRPTALSTTLEGFEAYRAAIERGRQASGGDQRACTHVSTALPAEYYRERGGLTIRGASPVGDAPAGVTVGAGSTAPSILTLALGPDGTVGSHSTGPDELGLRAVHGVGRKRAEALRRAGVETRAALAGANLARLADLDGVGRGTARRLREHARAHRDGAVVRRGDEALPGPEPVFVDVETDGLSPSIVWLIGVLDRGGRGTDASEDQATYASFLTRDPDEPGEALEAFCSWYLANASDRPIVAYNGHSFDFPVIEAQIERHCPGLLEDWQRAWRFDPYAWAVRDGNAVLPGRTNALEDVAAALGYESATGDGEQTRPTPLTGAEVGRIYRRWMHERTPAAEPDWERLQAYCEDDVRALAHVYDALGDASRRAAADAGTEPAAERTTQGQLGDF